MKNKEYEYLDEKLAAYAKSDYYPFHMPGHKRAAMDFENPYQIDVTEIDGFDNLHYAQDLLLRSQERLRGLYKSKKAYFMVNGSSGGILSAVGALTKCGDKIVMARNCHKSVYNAVKLFQLKAQFVYPRLMTCGIQGGIQADDIEQCLQIHRDARLVIITSPTYDGIVSDIQKISEIARKYHTYLIIDEAHGAHFSLSPYFPESAVRLGADLVIQSLHKTLPCFTQSAVLHIVGDRVDFHKLEEMLRVFQTSSPSYILMAGMEKCVRILIDKGEQLFEAYAERLADFYKKCRNFKCLRVLTADDYDAAYFFEADQSKIIISTMHTALSGQALDQKLSEEYHLQMEMYSAQYVLAMTSIMDRQEGFDRLFHALYAIDQEQQRELRKECIDWDNNTKYNYNMDNDFKDFLKNAYAERKKVLEISEIDDDNIVETNLEDCAGETSAEYVYLYPPGIPMIVPGEIITHELIELLNQCRKSQMNVQGTRDQQYRKILTVAQKR